MVEVAFCPVGKESVQAADVVSDSNFVITIVGLTAVTLRRGAAIGSVDARYILPFGSKVQVALSIYNVFYQQYTNHNLNA